MCTCSIYPLKLLGPLTCMHAGVTVTQSLYKEMKKGAVSESEVCVRRFTTLQFSSHSIVTV